jgi:hypothetical protein
VFNDRNQPSLHLPGRLRFPGGVFFDASRAGWQRGFQTSRPTVTRAVTMECAFSGKPLQAHNFRSDVGGFRIRSPSRRVPSLDDISPTINEIAGSPLRAAPPAPL